MTTSQDQLKRILRGTTRVVSEAELVKKLQKKKPLRVKLGVDPTAPDIHLGHTVVLNKLRVFQDLGHIVIFIIGDFTASVGDPSGRDATRPALSDQDIKANIKTYTDQVFRVLDKKKTEVKMNGDWLQNLFKKDHPDFLPKGLLRNATVQQLMERDDFSKRREAGQPISLLELLYPLFQGYDSVAVKADIELGGNDQIFNLLMGRQLQKDAGQEPQVVMTLPLLEGLDGVRKMSKSYGNHVGLNDSPNDMFGKVMSVSDDLMWKYYELLTEEDLDSVKALHPKEAKMKLAALITARYHGKEAGQEARTHFENVFAKGNTPDDIETVALKASSIDIIDLLLQTQMAPSKKEARRLLEQGGVQIDGEKTALGQKISLKKPVLLKVGKRRFKKVHSGV